MDKKLEVIGRSERVDFPEQGLQAVPARIDTGAKTSSIWVSDVKIQDGALEFVLFGQESEFFTGEVIHTSHYETRTVASSNGSSEERFVVRLLVVLKGRRIRAHFTLANREQQAYPVLVGRNVLRGKFLVDVKRGQPDFAAETRRSLTLQNLTDDKEELA